MARAKDSIIAQIDRAALTEHPHPGAFIASNTPDHSRSIEEVITASGATAISCSSEAQFLEQHLPTLLSSASYFSMLEDSAPLEVEALLGIETTVAKAEFLVREHGALWVPAPPMRQAAPLFTCEHLILLLSRQETVPTMVEATHRIAHRPGWFICGPSKTADIEQCLVVGAQGARRVSVGIYD